jgi:thioredoxin-related protein
MKIDSTAVHQISTIMKSVVFSILLVFSANSFAQINFESLTFDQALAKAKSENKKIFIDVFTTWCGPCKNIDRNVFQTKEIGDRMNPDYVSIKVDAENSPDRSRVVAYGIPGYPTMLILDGDGKELYRIIGSRTVEGFHSELDKQLPPEMWPQNIALNNMIEHQNDEAVWRESMAVLYMKDNERFIDNCQTFVNQFGLNELNNSLDSNIFYYAVLPLNSPIPQRILKDPEFMTWNREMYKKMDMRERARTAKTAAAYQAVVDEANAFEQEQYEYNSGDYLIDQEFLDSLSIENLKPMYLQNPEPADSKKERKKKKKRSKKEKK